MKYCDYFKIYDTGSTNKILDVKYVEILNILD